jgi:peptidoglycan/LPS O-acetylase OafA/YrhL
LSTTPEKSKAYRPDIDGLRAVAVISVFLYHLEALRVTGGFVGVDIFFVISGYLITSILAAELRTGRFSIAAFYERRIRRIVPALLAMLIATTATAWIFLLPSEMVSYSHSLLAALFSASNFFFYSQAGYFDAPSASKPLLHTWSLAVEEQFYLFFPLLLAFIFRYWRRSLVAILGFISLLSLGFCIWATTNHPSFAFFWPFTRAWELQIGSLIALVNLPIFKSRLVREAGTLTGIGLIGYSLFVYTAYIPFPGIAALPPCLGAALIIAAGVYGTSMVGKLLSLRPVVFVGLISYSLYLWHWPVIVYQKMGLVLFPGAPRQVEKGITLLIGFSVAVLSWYFVERPFRKPKGGSSRPKVFAWAAASTAAMALTALVLLMGNGMPSRFPARAVQIASYLDNPDGADRWHYREGECFLTSADNLTDFKPASCLHSDPTRENILILGDSHAAQLDYGLQTTYPNANFMQATASGCKPTLHQGLDRNQVCVHFMDSMLKDYLPNHRPQRIFLAGRWNDSDLERIGETLAYLKSLGIKTTLFGPIMQYDMPLPRLLAMAIKANDPDLATAHRQRIYLDLDAKMSALAASSWDVEYVSYFKLFCANGPCQQYADNLTPLQGDMEHLTGPGSLIMASRIGAVVRPH